MNSVYCAEYICNTTSQSIAYYDDDETKVNSFIISSRPIGNRYILGKDSKVAYYDSDSKSWIWESLILAQNGKSNIYYHSLTEGGMFTAVFNHDRKKVITTYSSDDAGLVSYTNTEQCIEM